MNYKRIKDIFKNIILVIVFFGIIGSMSSCINSEEVRNETKTKVENEIATYKTDKNGIRVFDMSKDHYFLNKQRGYDYPSSETLKYYSKVLKKERSAKMYLPPNYDKNKEYPVLILLHGLNGSKITWGNKDADIIIQNIAYFEDGKEMIIVCPDSNLNQKEDLEGLDFMESLKCFDLTRDEVVDSLLPELKKQYKIKSGRENMAIAGHSLGGRNALYTGFSYPEIFGYVGAFAPVRVADYGDIKVVKPLLKTFKVDKKYKHKLVMISVGNSDKRVGNSVDDLSQFMNKEGVDHIFYHLPGGHENTVWKNSLYNFVRHIFK